MEFQRWPRLVIDNRSVTMTWQCVISLFFSHTFSPQSPACSVWAEGCVIAESLLTKHQLLIIEKLNKASAAFTIE